MTKTATQDSVVLRDDLLRDEIAIPIGDDMYCGNARLLCRWSNGNFQVFYNNEWQNSDRENFKR